MDDLELIKDKINIVDLIGEYLPLKKSGINYKANCPFHQEKTPSFMVSPERQIFRCFGCGKGGDIFKFMMEKEGYEFKDALEVLALKAGVTLKKKAKSQSDDALDRLYELNSKSAQFYNYLLTEHKLGKKALDYLKGRGLSLETIKLFNIGYAPQNWETLVRFLKKRGYKIEEMIESGLVVASSNGGYDRFRGRIMFPLLDVRGRVIGFSGRVLGDELPKYINSPQTRIFDKGKFLLGLNLSKAPIKEKEEAIVVEGELDFLMSYQSGIKNIVASKGTSLTEAQVQELKKYASTLVLCFDTDFAGDQAARRGIEIADKAGMNIKVIDFEGVKDPAELVKTDPELWEQAVRDALPIYDYYLKSVSLRFNPKQASGKRSIFAEVLPIWSKISDPITREHYIEKLAAFLQVKEDFVREALEDYKRVSVMPKTAQVLESKKDLPQSKPKTSFDRREMLENYLIALLLRQPPGLNFIPNFPETLFTQEELKQVYVLLVLFLDSISFKSQEFKISEFIKSMPQEYTDLIDRLYLMEIDEKLSDTFTWEKEVGSVVGELKKMLIKASLEKLSLQIKSAQEFGKIETLNTLNKRFRDLSVKLKNL
jgi:DNA primase